MRRIFEEKILRIDKVENTYPLCDTDMVGIHYADNSFTDNPNKEFITGICFDSQENIILRMESASLDSPFYVMTNDDEDKYIFRIILKELEIKKSLYLNFNPYVRGKGRMIFLDNESDVTGIGIDHHGFYILQTIDEDSEKYRNSLSYKKLKI